MAENIIDARLAWYPWRWEFWRALLGAPYRTLNNPPIFDTALFPGGQELIDDFDAIRAECVALAIEGEPPTFDELMPGQRDFYEHDQRNWRMAVMRTYCGDVAENLARTPRLKAFLDRHPEVTTAVISVFEPQKHVAPHDGPFRGIMRYHLGLLVESYEDGTTAGKLIVDGETYYVREGESMLWDDTYIHEAYNTSDKPRIALLLDVYRPDMSLPLRLYTNAILWGVRQALVISGGYRRAVVPQAK